MPDGKVVCNVCMQHSKRGLHNTCKDARHVRPVPVVSVALQLGECAADMWECAGKADACLPVKLGHPSYNAGFELEKRFMFAMTNPYVYLLIYIYIQYTDYL